MGVGFRGVGGVVLLSIVSMNETLRSAINKANLISASGRTIYDAITVKITNLIITNGLNFFARMPRLEGKVLNKKLRIKLLNDFFDL